MRITTVVEGLTQHNYTFYIIDPMTGEFTKYYSGSPISIIQQLQRDPENSKIAEVIKQQPMAGKDGVISFKYDDHIYAFMPN